jgi:hypothetical protein
MKEEIHWGSVCEPWTLDEEKSKHINLAQQKNACFLKHLVEARKKA